MTRIILYSNNYESSVSSLKFALDIKRRERERVMSFTLIYYLSPGLSCSLGFRSHGTLELNRKPNVLTAVRLGGKKEKWDSEKDTIHGKLTVLILMLRT